MRPHREFARKANGVTQQYQALPAQVPGLPSIFSGSSFDIDTCVVIKAPDGLFYILD